MSDVPDGSGQMPRRAPRVGDHAAPVSGVLAIVLAVIAVVAGFLILRTLSDGGGSGSGNLATGGGSSGQSDGDTGTDEGGDDASDPSDSTVAQLPTTTTQPALVTTGASVVVANANGVDGSAGKVTRVLQTGAGFDTVDPVNSSSSFGDQETSSIYYDASNPGAQLVAESLNTVLGGTHPIAPMPDVGPPTRDGELNGGDVLLMLGVDLANTTLADLSLPSSTTSNTNPPVASESTTTTTVG